MADSVSKVKKQLTYNEVAYLNAVKLAFDYTYSTNRSRTRKGMYDLARQYVRYLRQSDADFHLICKTVDAVAEIFGVTFKGE